MLEPGYPCFLCGVNAWTSCRHRAAPQDPPPILHVRPPQFSSGGRFSRERHNEKNLKRVKAYSKTLLGEIETFLDRENMAPATFSRLALGDPSFVSRLRKGLAVRSKTIEKIRLFMQEKIR